MQNPEIWNLFDEIPDSLPEEWTQPLLTSGNVRIERIVSRGHTSPPEFWYDQPELEWVMVLRGWARVSFRNPDAVVELGPGDSLTIPARREHRVDWTAPDEETIWLAVFISEAALGEA